MYKLLIVDDEPLLVEGLAEIVAGFEKHDLEIYKAYSTSEALAIMNQSSMDIVLSDICMPNMSGLDLMEKIGENWPRCKVIFLTGYDNFEYIHTAMRKGAVDYLLKSEDIDTIKATLYKAIAGLEEENEKVLLLKKAKQFYEDAFPLLQLDETLDLTGEIGRDSIKNAIRQVNEYIRENIHTDFSLTTIAEIVHFNPSYLSRTYKHETGKNIMDYIQEVRMEHAKQLLSNSHFKINDIAGKIGIEAAYFSKVFKKFTGLTPQEYRERHENK